MVGTLVNVLAIIIGSLVGIFLKKGIKEDYKNIVIDGMSWYIREFKN